jgi:chromosome partitioning protein
MKKFVLSVASHKGGVGKTSLCFNLPFLLTNKGYSKILLIDLDPQANLSEKFVEEKPKLNISTYLDFLNETEADNDLPLKTAQVLDDIILRNSYNGSSIDIITSNLTLSKVKLKIQNSLNIIFKAQKSLIPFLNEYDAVIIDLPPSVEFLTILALSISTDFIVPSTMDRDSIQGVNDIIKLYNEISQYYNQKLNFAGVVASIVDNRTTIDKEVKNVLYNIFNDKFFNSQISRSVKMKESLVLKSPLIDLNDNTNTERIYRDINDFVDELLDKTKGYSNE